MRLKAEFNPVGFNLLNNNGEKAGQTVFHFHLHLIPRYGEKDGFGAVWKSHKMNTLWKIYKTSQVQLQIV